MKINILMDGNKMCIAWFKKKIKKFVLSTDAQPTEGGTITGAGTYDEGTVVEVEAVPNPDYEFSHWEGDVSGKWSGLGMHLYYLEESYIDTLLANGFNELRIDGPSYEDPTWVTNSKETVLVAVSKGVNVVWGVNIGGNTITDANWNDGRLAVLAAAQWAQDNGVYEFQLGNEMELHNDDTTLTDAQLIANLKSLATEVQAIFTNGKVSYSCFHENIADWVSAGKGDIDILASNVYMEWGNHNSINWKAEVDALVNAFGVDGTYLTEFNLNTEGLDMYSTDEAVQATKITEMINYIKASGMTRAIYFAWKAHGVYGGGSLFGVAKDDDTYRQLWDSLLNSN